MTLKLFLKNALRIIISLGVFFIWCDFMEKEQSFIKKDTTENWNKAKRFIPKENEVIVYTDAGTKIGDGKTLLHELPFIN